MIFTLLYRYMVFPFNNNNPKEKFLLLLTVKERGAQTAFQKFFSPSPEWKSYGKLSFCIYAMQ